MTDTIYKGKKELAEKYLETLKALEVKNTKEDKTPYDMGVLFDMLVADYKAIASGQELPYQFDGSEDFDWTEFGKEYAGI